MRVSDLEIAKNPDIEILSPLDDMVFSIVNIHKPMEILETDEETGGETDGETAETESE